jgi:murein L,D-transpeptidase YcbB/YkuD
MDRHVRALDAVQKFYAQRDYRPAWHGPNGQTRLDQLAQAVEEIAQHGLDPTHYSLDLLGQGQRPDDGVALELIATDTYLTLAAHLLGGKLDPLSLEPDWTAIRRQRDLVAHLEQAITRDAIASSLHALAPKHAAYAILQQALAVYGKAVENGGWRPIEDGSILKLGDTSPRVLALRLRLQATGLLSDEANEPDRFDEKLEAAVAAFQRRIGLEADGVVGPLTLNELNKSPEMRVSQIRANLERWRWLPDDLGQRHIRVNIADYRLEAYRDGSVERVHDVIVGRTYRKTPVFSERISYVILNPWWETPHNLARLDKLPAFQKDPASADQLGFEILNAAGEAVPSTSIDWTRYNATHFPFRLRQSPGPHNALGKVKLMFPNPHNVYLHDTPDHEMFSRSGRAFSSGCIRVADALGLTEWVLQETPGWDRQRIDTVVESGRETRVNLGVRVPVHLLYFTAVAEPDGSLRLINDVYDRDQRLISALSKSTQ